MDQRSIEGSSMRMRSHCIHIDNRELSSITGVKDVISFNEQEIVLATEAGDLHIDGDGMRITKLNLDDGQVIVEGHIIAFEYTEAPEERGSLFSRMFR